MHYFQPGTRSYFNGGYMPVLISGDEILIHPSDYLHISRLRNMKIDFVGDGQTAIVTPLSPGAYPLLGLHSPVWEINALFPRSDLMQILEVERIRNSDVGLVIVEDIAIDGREDLRFKNTHPIVYKHIIDNFVFLPSRSTPTEQVFVKKAVGT